MRKLLRIAVPVILALALMGLVVVLVGCKQNEPLAFGGWADRVYAKWHTFQSAVVTDTNGTAMNVAGFPVVGVQVDGIVGATINFEATTDDSNWDAVEAIDTSSGAKSTTATADAQYMVPVAGKSQLRCRVSSWTSGTITITGIGITHPDTNLSDVVLGAPADGTYIGDIKFGEEVDLSDDLTRLVGRVSNYDVLANGTITNATTSTVEMAGQGLSTIGLGVSGTWTGTIVVETTAGDSVWDPIPLVDNTLGSAALSTSSNGNFVLGVAGSLTVRVRATAWTGGTATVYLEGTSAAAGVFLSRSLPTGLNAIGTVGVTSISAGETHVGEVGTKSDVISVTLTLAASTYASGDVLADTQEIADAMRVNAGTGIPYSVAVIDLDDQAQALDILLLDANCSIGTEDSAVSIADSCADDILCVVEIGAADYVDLVNSQVAMGAPACVVESTAGINELWFAVVSRGTGTYTASGIVLKFGFLND